MDSITAAYQLTGLLFWAVHVIPQLALITRRIHDTGFSRAWVFVGLVPVVGPLTLLILATAGSAPAARTRKQAPPPLSGAAASADGTALRRRK